MNNETVVFLKRIQFFMHNNYIIAILFNRMSIDVTTFVLYILYVLKNIS